MGVDAEHDAAGAAVSAEVAAVAADEGRQGLLSPTGLGGGVVVLLLSLFCNFWMLGDAPISRTEGHRALTAHEMVQTGQWLTPHLHGKPYLRKPPLQYWLIASVEWAAGRGSELIWRTPSAACATGLAILIWWWTRRRFGGLAGLVAGLAVVGLIPLWPQNRSADIDAANTLASVACAIALLELAVGLQRARRAGNGGGDADGGQPIGEAAPDGGIATASEASAVDVAGGGREPLVVWSLVLLMGFAALWLLKGPAGLMLVGGAVVGGCWAVRSGWWLARPIVWAPMVLGIGVFGLWGWAAHASVTAQSLPGDTSGVQEVIQRLTPDSEKLLRGITMPAVLFAYALPLSLSLVTVGRLLMPGRAAAADADRLTSRETIDARALMATTMAGLLICGLAMIERPRYGYIVLPMLAPLVGLTAAAWRRGLFDDRWQTLLRATCTVTVAAVTAAGVGLSVAAWRNGFPHHALLASLAGLTVLAGVAATAAWVRQRVTWGAWGLAVVTILAAASFSPFKNQDRTRQSMQQSAPALRQIIGDAKVVRAEAIAQDRPELFHYADVLVQRYPGGMAEALKQPDGAWVVFSDVEWAAHARQLEGTDEPEGAPERASRAQALPFPPGTRVTWVAGVPQPKD